MRIPTDARKTMQLQHELHIGLGLKYEIVLNVNTEDGLTNGASCTVKCVQVRNDAVKRGTQRPPYGIAVYYKPHLVQQPPAIANMNGVEILVCPVKRGSDNSITVMAVYKPPAIPLHCLLNSLYSAIRNHCGDGQLIIMGDFNVDIYGSTSDYKQLEEFMSNMGLQQHIKEMTTDMRTAIDHIYSNVESIMCGVSETYYSFHKSIWVALL